MKRPGFNSKRVVMVQAHYENGHYVPPVYIGDRSLKSPVSARDHLANGWKTLNRPREIYLGASRGVKVLLLLMLIVAGVLVADQHFKSPDIHGLTGGTSYVDPFQTLWVEQFDGNDLSGWNRFLAVYNAGLPKALELDANSTHTAVALTKTSLSMDVAAKKELQFFMSFRWANVVSTGGTSWGWYLTRNSTVPQTPNYEPKDDPSIAMLFEVHDNAAGNCASGTAFTSTGFVQRDPTEAVGQGISAASGVGTQYLQGQGPARTGVCDMVTNQFSALKLNFTGNPSSPNAVSRLMRLDQTEVTTGNFPWFQFQGVSYYFGVYQRPNANASHILWIGFQGSGGMYIAWGLWTALVPAVQPQEPDTGGWFGPIIKALISIGVFILASIAKFFSYVYTAFINGLDVVGNFLGLGAIGSAFAGALKGFADWIINIFGNIFLQSLNFVNFITSGLNLLINGVSNYWAGATAFVTQLGDLLGQAWGIVTTGLQFGTLGIKWLVMVWLIWGIMGSASSMSSFQTWFEVTSLFTLKLFSGLYWIGDQAFLTILRAKQLIAQWM